MQGWYDLRQPLLAEFVRVKDVCQMVLDYAYELQGSPSPLTQPQHMAHIWMVTALPHAKFATALITDEILLWDLVNERSPATGVPLAPLIDEDLHDMIGWVGTLVTATQRMVRSWDTTTGQVLSTLLTGSIDMLTVSDDWLILGTFDGEITVLDGIGRVFLSYQYGSTMVRIFGLPNSTVGICDGNKVSLFRMDLSGVRLLWSAPGYYHMTVHRDTMVAAYIPGVVRVWDTNLTMDIDCQATALCALYGQRVAVACNDHAVGVYDLRTHCYTPLSQVGETRNMIVNRLIELPDGRLAGYTDQCIVVWDLQTKQHIVWPRPCYPVTTFKMAGSMLLICYDHFRNRLHVLQ